MHFWLGVHCDNWLAKTTVPLFVSRRRLASRRRLPRALGSWALDSGAFTELRQHGQFLVTAREYATQIQRFAEEIGGLAWAAPQDWMCEPFILARTGLTVAEHQRRTITGYLTLRALTDLVVPVVQGWTPHEYEDHVEQYAGAGIDLTQHAIVGIGSVCRRQDMTIGARIIERLWGLGLKLHGFGVKTTGLRAVAHLMASADSMAWSFVARREQIQLPGCAHRSCANCLRYAVHWREAILETIARPKQWPMVLNTSVPGPMTAPWRVPHPLPDEGA
jgi:hypothetical protein